MMTLALFDLGFTELLVVAFIALLVFGGELPDVMRKVGRSYARLRKSLNEVTKPVREEMRNITKEVDETARTARRARPSTPPASTARYETDAPKTAATPTRPPPTPSAGDPFDEPPPV